MELHQVRYFLALSRTLNFTRASEACNVTQPALTRSIQRLEDELGGPLIYRERNLTHLTELGRAMLPHLEASFAAAQTAKQLAGSLRRHEQMLLKVGLAQVVPASLICPSLAELVRRFATLEVGIETGEQERLIDAMLESDLEAALLIDDGQLPERLHRWKLSEEGCSVVFWPGHRFEPMETIPLAELDGETVLQGRGCGDATALCGPAGASIRLRHSGGNLDHLQHLVAARLGIALLPRRWPVLPPLLSRPLADETLARLVVLAVVSGRQHSPALDGFVKLIRVRSFALG